MPERRKLDLRSFDDMVGEVDRLRQGGYSRAGNWDLGQVCQHLAISMKSSLDGFQVRAPWYLRLFLAPIFKRRLFRTRSMPAGIKGPPDLMPAATVDEETAVKSFKDETERLRNHVGDFQPHAFFGKMTPQETRDLHLIHASLHLSFLIPRPGG
jgi:hypothetical protein